MLAYLKRHWPLLGIAILLGVVAFYLFGAGRLGKHKLLVENVLSREGIRLDEIHLRQDDPDKGVRWVLDAREVRISRDQRFVHFVGFDLTVEPEQGEWIKLKGREGDYARDSGEIVLRGAIEGETAEGYRLQTERLLIKENERTVESDVAVQLSGPFFLVTGQGLFFDLKKNLLLMPADVTARLW